jgi:hypothetical protein
MPIESGTKRKKPKSEQRYIRLFEEMGLRFLYSLRPRQPFLDTALAYCWFESSSFQSLTSKV